MVSCMPTRLPHDERRATTFERAVTLKEAMLATASGIQRAHCSPALPEQPDGRLPVLVVCNKITSPPAGKPPVLNMNTKPRESTRVTCQEYRANSSCKKLALDSAVTKCAVTKFSRLDLCDV
jgi:hypothetical protein